MGRLSPSDRAKEEAMRRAARDPSIPQNLMASRQPRALVGQKAPSQADFDFIKQLEAASAPMRRPIMKGMHCLNVCVYGILNEELFNVCLIWFI